MAEKKKYTIEIEIPTKLTLTDEAPDDVITRCFTKEWQDHMFTLATEDEVMDHLAYNLIENGVEDISRLDGWADIPEGVAMMSTDW